MKKLFLILTLLSLSTSVFASEFECEGQETILLERISDPALYAVYQSLKHPAYFITSCYISHTPFVAEAGDPEFILNLTFTESVGQPELPKSFYNVSITYINRILSGDVNPVMKTFSVTPGVTVPTPKMDSIN